MQLSYCHGPKGTNFSLSKRNPGQFGSHLKALRESQLAKPASLQHRTRVIDSDAGPCLRIRYTLREDADYRALPHPTHYDSRSRKASSALPYREEEDLILILGKGSAMWINTGRLVTCRRQVFSPR